MGWRVARIVHAVLVVGLCWREVAAALDSLPGDADCDGVVLRNDVDHVIAELDDGDGSGTETLDGGEVRSCTGADANGDGQLTVADVTAIARLLSGQRPEIGPIITFIGVAAADGTQTVSMPGVAPVFQRPGGLGFHLIVEVGIGPSGAPIGQQLLNSDPNDPTEVPDLQLLFSQPLQRGSTTVCDEEGVPANAPPSFSQTQAVANALNDAACRFRAVSNPSVGCTVDAFGVHRFASGQTRTQFCLLVSGAETFADGSTLVTARVLDIEGNPGPPAQIIVHVGTGPLPTPLPTLTLTPTRAPTATHTPTAMATRTSSPTASGTRTGTRTATTGITPGTRTSTRTTTATPVRTSTRTPTGATRTPTRTRLTTPTRTPTAGRTFTPTRTRPPSRTPTVTATPTRTRVPTLTRTPTTTRTVTKTGTATRTRPPTQTPTITRTRTITRTPTVTRTIGPTARPGADVSFIGVARPDDRLQVPDIPGPVPVFIRPLGHGFTLVVEGKPGPSRRPVGRSSFNYAPGDANTLPDLQVIVSRGLGEEPTTAVCDDELPFFGGVPASPDFLQTPAVAAAINDLGCRFVNGEGRPIARTNLEACTLFPDGEYHFNLMDSTVQFCAQVPVPLAFAPGDTTVTVRLRDTTGAVGPSAQMIIRVE